MTGLNQTDLSAAVLPVSGRRRSLLPQGISPAQEHALLRACDRRRGTGRRDYAVIVLMLRLGLRASEVAVLALDDLDWRAGLLTVHGKRAQVDQLPLPVDVGEAIASYLRHGRPRTSVREVFVRVMPPRVGLTRHGASNPCPRRIPSVRCPTCLPRRTLVMSHGTTTRPTSPRSSKTSRPIWPPGQYGFSATRDEPNRIGVVPLTR